MQSVLQLRKRSKNDDRPVFVLRPVLATNAIKNENWRCKSIFQTKFRFNEQLCSLVIDGGNCTNGISEETYRKLRLKTKSHLNLYKVAQINNKNSKIHERCLVTYSIRSFRDQVLCDVLLLKVCHLLLGRPWLYNKKAQPCEFKNTTFQHGKKVTMVPCLDVLYMKLKKTVGSYLLHHMLSGGDGLLGPPRNSMGLSYFQREGVDAVVFSWLQKTQPFWKPKSKSKGVFKKIVCYPI